MSEWQRLRGELKPEDNHPEGMESYMVKGASRVDDLHQWKYNCAGDTETAIQDILSDLIHLADREGIDWEEVYAKASRIADWEAVDWEEVYAKASRIADWEAGVKGTIEELPIVRRA